MPTSIFDPPAFIQARSAPSDNVGRTPGSIATGSNAAEKLLDETVGAARGARILLPAKKPAVASVPVRVRGNTGRTANALVGSKWQSDGGCRATVTRKDSFDATMIAAETIRTAVLFADMRGYTGLAEQLPPARVVSILNEFFTMLARETVKFGGQVFHMAGDGMMAGFGVRDPRRSGARAALAAGHAMHQSFAPVAARWRSEFAVITGIGIGVHSGEVAIGSLGPPGREVITMIGDTANVAARLCDRARAGEVLFSGAIAAALRTDDDGFDMGANPFLQLSQFELRGRSELLDIWCVPAPERIAH
jgi:class 3 adenylate cyclase